MKRALFYGWSLVCVCFSGGVLAQQTSLDRYVAKPDPNYAYGAYSTDRDLLKPYTTYFLRMRSQQWRSADEVDRPLWEHVIAITVPLIRHSSSPRTAILLVNGGSNRESLPTKTDDRAAAIAVALGSVVAAVSQIPNQPLFFTDEDNVARSEDAIIAYSFDKFLDTGDEEWPALLPMTKAVVRAMDTVQAYLANRASIRIDDFVIVGGSKRGWTTWLTAAVDPRVKAVAPASIDLLNMQAQFRRQFEAYGFYAPAIADYVAFNLPVRIGTPEGQVLLSIVDPYAYRDRFTMPKIILNSTGDQFFLPDSSQFYYAELPEFKWLRYAPNTDHAQSLDVAASLASWVDQINDNSLPPQYSWTVEPDGAIRVEARDRPDRVRLWQATNPEARDFRLEAIGPVWTSSDLAPIGPGIYRGYVPPPSRGWTAYMVELTYEESGVLEPNQVFTTDVVVTPDTLPFAGVNPSPIVGTEFDDLLEGTPAGDMILGLGGNDILRGFAGNDMLNGGPGNDMLEGGSGADVAVYAEERNGFTVLGYGGEVAVGYRPPGGEGLDLLFGVESLRFGDRTLSSAQADSPSAYLASYADLIEAFGPDEAAGFDHYIRQGYSEGRTVTFDGYRYIASYADLILALGADATAGARHYIDAGYREGRTATFDGYRYIASYVDLILALGADATAGAKHYIDAGYREGRTATFDGYQYIASYGDLIVAFGADETTGAWHYIVGGYSEGRSVDRFDEVQYVANYPDLQNAFGTDYRAATVHFITNGYFEGRTDRPIR